MFDSKIKCGSEFKTLFELMLVDSKPCIISFVNPFSYYILREDNKYLGVDSYFSDGLFLCLMHSFRYKKIDRASFDFSSIADYVFSTSVDKNLKLSIIGATKDENEKAVNNLKMIYQGLDIIFSFSGYIDDKCKLIKNLNDKKPDLIILGLGTPYQEDLALLLKRKLKFNCLIITCGGFLTQTSIRNDYYLPIVKKLGIRWLQRAIMHKHVRKRLLNEYPLFLVKYIRETIRMKF
ncbi:TPA: WecB/TagA/CpsF family glycosyltransferase [Photobacterium damselae]